MKLSRIEQLAHEAVELSERLGPILAELIATARNQNSIEKKRQVVAIKQSIKSLNSAGVAVPDELQRRLNDLNQILKDFEIAEKAFNVVIEKIPALSQNQCIKRVSHRKGENAETMPAQLLSIINSRKDGIQYQELAELTNFKGRQLQNTIFRLKRDGAIKNIGKGLYVAVENVME